MDGYKDYRQAEVLTAREVQEILKVGKRPFTACSPAIARSGSSRCPEDTGFTPDHSLSGWMGGKLRRQGAHNRL